MAALPLTSPPPMPQQPDVAGVRADAVDAAFVGSPIGAGDGHRTEPAPDEARLLERLRDGDEDAFVVLLEQFGPSLRRFARAYGSEAIADEVVQETWIGLIRGIHRFEGRSSLRTWLFGITKNIARTRGAREGREIPLSALERESDDVEPAVDPRRFRQADDPWVGHWLSYPERWDELPERRYLSTEGVEVARGAIDALPPSQREVVTLRDVEGWPSDEVCLALGISPGNQRVLLHRGRSTVRAALEVALARTNTDGQQP